MTYYGEEKITLKRNTMVIALCINEKLDGQCSSKKYVTAVFDCSDDLRTESDKLSWFGHPIWHPIWWTPNLVDSKKKTSLWRCDLFPVCGSEMESLTETLAMMKEGIEGTAKKRMMISIENAIKNCNIEATLKKRV